MWAHDMGERVATCACSGVRTRPSRLTPASVASRRTRMFSPGSRFHMGSKRPATNHSRDSVWLEKPMGKFRKKPAEAEAHPAHTVAAVRQPVPEMDVLPVKYATFVSEYLVDYNGGAAAVAAGFSKKTAHVQATRMLKNAKVRRAINEGQRLRSLRLGITADRIAVELANIAFADLRDIVTIEGGQMRVRDTAELTRQQSAAISEISETNAGLRVRMHSKVAALENLGKQLGIIDQVPVTQITTTESSATRQDAR